MNSWDMMLIYGGLRFQLLLCCVILFLVISGHEVSSNHIIQKNLLVHNHRTFRVDYISDQFLKDGQPFRYVSGSFHYFRALPETWQRKLRIMRAAGLNAVTTYVEWSLHNPRDGVYKWTGIANVVRFIQLAAQEDLLVILRPGPYICAERDFGGFPYWLLNKHPNIKMRTMDKDYLNEVSIWYNKLMPRLTKYLYENGGPIIMVQVENEYGSYGCDVQFRDWMKQETERHVGGAAVLFTNDGPQQTSCGKIEGVLATLDFGAGSVNATNENWSQLRQHQPNGPLVNSEYYPGWLTHWQEPSAKVDTQQVVDTLKFMLDRNASVNFYMFFGGTNFGFTAGANDGGPGRFNADLTSYDYDAPLDEAGDPRPKYFAISDAIAEYMPMPDLPFPVILPKMAIEIPVQLHSVAGLFSTHGRMYLSSRTVLSEETMSFERFNQYSGFILYETELPHLKSDPSVLDVNDLRDRALVYVDRHFIGTLSRQNQILRLPINVGLGQTLQIFVENQGRINYNEMEDFKGILGDVLLNGKRLLNWNHTGYPLDDASVFDTAIANSVRPVRADMFRRSLLSAGPVLFHGEFIIPNEQAIYDTYLDPSGWGKGVAFVNGFNLGRYWPLIGPQITLYVPKEILHHGQNNVSFVELQRCPAGRTIQFVSQPIFD